MGLWGFEKSRDKVISRLISEMCVETIWKEARHFLTFLDYLKQLLVMAFAIRTSRICCTFAIPLKLHQAAAVFSSYGQTTSDLNFAF